MKKEESLIEIKENKFMKILNSLKCFVRNLFKKNKNTPIIETEKNIEETKKEEISNLTENNPTKTLQDMELLSKVVKGEIKSSTLELEVQKRLIQLCIKRRMEIKEKIKQTDEKITKMNQLLFEIKEAKRM